MRKTIVIGLLVAFSYLSAQEHPKTPRSNPGVAAAHGTYDTVAISMLAWGVGLGVGIALLAGFLDFDDGNGSNGGNSSHSH
jgi:hypothetical protein